MAEDDIFVARLFERIRVIEWDEAKAASNRRKHGIDFDEAIEIFYGTSCFAARTATAEERWLAIGETEGRVVTVVFTWRADVSGSSRHAAREKMKERAYYQEKIGANGRKGKTDWVAVDALDGRGDRGSGS